MPLKEKIKLIIFGIFFLGLLLTVNLSPTVKNALLDFGEQTRDTGWIGTVVLIGFCGFIVIPLALPYAIFEVCFAFMSPTYLVALGYSFGAKTLGTLVSFVFARTFLEKSIRKKVNQSKVCIAIEAMLEERPFYFSFLFRAMIAPLFIKNYVLALPRSIKLPTYMLAAIVTSTLHSLKAIYLMRRSSKIKDALDEGDDSSLIIYVVMIIFSICLMIYSVRYTKKMMKKLEKIGSEKLKERGEGEVKVGIEE